MVGGGMSGKGGAVNTGDLPGQEAARPPAEVRAAIVALKPGNAGGAKGPDFWCAFEDGEVRVIGDEPRNT